MTETKMFSNINHTLQDGKPEGRKNISLYLYKTCFLVLIIFILSYLNLVPSKFHVVFSNKTSLLMTILVIELSSAWFDCPLSTLPCLKERASYLKEIYLSSKERFFKRAYLEVPRQKVQNPDLLQDMYKPNSLIKLFHSIHYQPKQSLKIDENFQKINQSLESSNHSPIIYELCDLRLFPQLFHVYFLL